MSTRTGLFACIIAVAFLAAPTSATPPQWMLHPALWPGDLGRVDLPQSVLNVPIFGTVTEPLCVENGCSVTVNGEAASFDRDFSNGVVVDVRDSAQLDEILLTNENEERVSLFNALDDPCPISVQEVRASVVPLGDDDLGAAACAYKLARVDFDRRLLSTEYAVVTVGENERTRNIIVNDAFPFVATLDDDVAPSGGVDCAYTDNGDVSVLEERVSVFVYSMCSQEAEQGFVGTVEFGLLTPRLQACSCSGLRRDKGPIFGLLGGLMLGVFCFHRKRRLRRSTGFAPSAELPSGSTGQSNICAR